MLASDVWLKKAREVLNTSSTYCKTNCNAQKNDNRNEYMVKCAAKLDKEIVCSRSPVFVQRLLAPFQATPALARELLPTNMHFLLQSLSSNTHAWLVYLEIRAPWTESWLQQQPFHPCLPLWCVLFPYGRGLQTVFPAAVSCLVQLSFWPFGNA